VQRPGPDHRESPFMQDPSTRLPKAHGATGQLGTIMTLVAPSLFIKSDTRSVQLLPDPKEYAMVWSL